MGNAVSNAVRTVDGGDEARREAEDVLDRIIILSEVKATNHYAKVLNNPIDKERLPIDKVVWRLHLAHCCVGSDCVAVRNAIHEYLGPYFKQEIIDGLTAVMFETMSKLKGSTSTKNSSEITSYAVTVGKGGGIGRIDCYMFFYEFQARHLKQVLENCLVTSLVVSSADTTNLTTSRLRRIAKATYSSPLPEESEKQAAERLETIEDMLIQELNRGHRKRSAPT